MSSSQTKLFSDKDIKEKVLIFSIRITLKEPLNGEVVKIKQEFIGEFGKQLLSTSQPHITIATFKMSSLYKPLLIESFEPLMNSKKFKLTTNGVGVLGNGNTLVVKINESKKFKEFLTNVRNIYTTRLRHKAKKFSLSYTPYIIIASFLTKGILYESRNYFFNRLMNEIIEVDSIFITTREYGKTWEWKYKLNFN